MNQINIELEKMRFVAKFIFAKIQERMASEQILNFRNIKMDILKELGDLTCEEEPTKVKRSVRRK